jgi:hypothetical protein
MDIKASTLKKALTLLDAIGAEYHLKFDGSEYGAKLETRVLKRVRSKYPLGALKAHVYPKISGMQVGDVESFDFSVFDKESIRGSVSSTASQLFGNGNYTTQTTDSKMEILRVA